MSEKKCCCKEKKVDTHDYVKEYYSERFKSDDNKKVTDRNTKYSENYLNEILDRDILEEIKKKNFGCGSPIPYGDLSKFHALDLGSGLGRDCFILSKLVGEEGTVKGIDMTESVVKQANDYREHHRQRFGYKETNVEFLAGKIENIAKLGIKDDSLDLVVSNCVLNLTPSKETVLKAVYKALKNGGELFFSDIYASRKLPEDFRKHKSLWGECISGALYVNDFIEMMEKIGFKTYVVRARVVPYSQSVRELLRHPTNFYSITFRCHKAENMTKFEENYGGAVIFKGDKFSNKFQFDFDKDFEKGVETKVSSNIFNILKQSKFAPFFEFKEYNNKEHLGRFDQYKNITEIIKLTEDFADDFVCTTGGCCTKILTTNNEGKKKCCGPKKETKCCESKTECCPTDKKCCESKKECCSKEKKCCEPKETQCCSGKKCC